jgi:hypothetical protein
LLPRKPHLPAAWPPRNSLESFAKHTRDLLALAREHRPPPIASTAFDQQMSQACLAVVRHFAAQLERVD